ncbi:MAG: hypothetical protein K2G89_02730 [Lachnospiraceae bacterium]|nr:hypothetical protein [Lachnospiraceae bacterium]
MKKKGLVLFAALAMAFAFTGCGNGGTKDVTTQGGSQAEAGGYSVTLSGVAINMNVAAADIISALGEPQDKYEAESCAFQGMDRTYTYPGFVLDTYENNGVETTLYVTFKDDTVSTTEGLCIGESVDKAKELYGTDGTDNGSSIVYKKGGSTLTIFYGGDGVITEIQYGAVTE